MKPILTFVLGALLASGLAVFLVKRDTSAPVDATPTAVNQSPVASGEPEQPVTAQPVPAPEHPSPVDTVPPRAADTRGSRADNRQTRGSSPAPSGKPATSSPQQQASNTPPPASSGSAQSGNTTSVSPGGGPPTTTINLPPPPDGSRSVAESKPAAPARVPKTVTIPAGTMLSIRVDERLSTERSQPGDSFRASLDQPLVVDGAVVAEKGARVEGRVVDSDPGGRVRGTALLSLELVRLNTADGQRVRLQTEGFTKQAQKSTKKDAAKIGIGAGIGAAIGAIAGGGKGAAIGAGVGSAAGTGAVMTSRGEAAEIPAETRMTFRLSQPITVTEKLN